MAYCILGYFVVVIFHHFGSDGYSFILASLNTIVCSVPCYKHVSFLCIMFVSEEYLSRIKNYFFCIRVVFLHMWWITVNISKTIKHIYIYIKTMCKITKIYTQGSRSWAEISVNNLQHVMLYDALINENKQVWILLFYTTILSTERSSKKII